MQDQQAKLTWRPGDVPVSARFDDPYYSLEDGLSETRHVFLEGNNLPERFRDGFHIAELGFGTGLNVLATLELWRATAASGTLRITSFEAYPMALPDMAVALHAFPDLGDLAEALVAALSKGPGARNVIEGATLEIIEGDARDTLPAWLGAADAWYLDGFSPAKNPELWEEGLMRAVAAHTAPAGTFATYTAAGAVRRALESAGFDVERVPGFGRKRHMTIGRLR